MAIDSTRYQTVTVSKKRMEAVRKLAKASRYPITTVIGYAIDCLLADEDAIADLLHGRVKEEGKTAEELTA